MRLGLELSILEVLARNRLRHIPYLENAIQLHDRSVCALLQFKPVQTFQDFVHTLDGIQRVREILKFAQSLLALLSEVHNTGIFRASKIRMDLSDIPDGHLSPKLLDISKNGQVIIYDGAQL